MRKRQKRPWYEDVELVKLARLRVQVNRALEWPSGWIRGTWNR